MQDAKGRRVHNRGNRTVAQCDQTKRQRKQPVPSGLGFDARSGRPTLTGTPGTETHDTVLGTYRFLMLAACLVFPAFGFVHGHLNASPPDSMGIRLAFALPTLVVLILSFTSGFVRRNIVFFGFAVFYALTASMLAIFYWRGLSVDYFVGVYLVFISITLVAQTPRQLACYFALTIPTVGVLCLVKSEGRGIHYLVLTSTWALMSYVVLRERLRMQDKLRISLSTLQTTLDSTCDGILITDNHRNIVGYNRTFKEMWGIPDAALESGDAEKVLASVLHQVEDPDACVARIMDLYSQPDENSYDLITRKDGSVLERRSQPRRMDGAMLGRVWGFRDVTESKQMEDALKHRVGIESLLAEVSSQFVALPPEQIDSGVDRALDEIGSFCGVDRAYIFMLAEDRKTAHMKYEWCAEGCTSRREKLRDVPTDIAPLWMSRLEKLDPIHVPRVAELPPEVGSIKEMLESLGVRSIVAVPLVENHSVIGALGLSSERTENTWSAEDITLLRMLGEIIVNALSRKRTEQALVDSETRYRTLVESQVEAVSRWLPDGTLTFVNEAYCRLFGKTREELLGHKWISMISESEQDEIAKFWQPLLKEPRVVTNEYEVVAADGQKRYMRWTHCPIAEPGGPVTEFQSVGRDFSERKRTEERLTRLNDCLLSFGLDPDDNINRLVGLCGDLLGATCALYNSLLDGGMLFSAGRWNTPPDFDPLDLAEGHICHDVIQSQSDEVFVIRDLQQTRYADTDPNVTRYNLQTYMGKAVKRGKKHIGALCVVYQDDRDPAEEDRKLLGIAASAIGVEAARKHVLEELRTYQRNLDHLAHHDALTDLPNRLLFSDRLSRTLAHARRQNRIAAVLFCDLDHFKDVNDTLGHNVGDLLLKQVAQRLTDSLREVDTIARVGGDEFTIILGNIGSANDAALVAGRILDLVSRPIAIEGHDLLVTTSIGISLYPSDGADAETLVMNADRAMYRAKEHGRNNYQFHREDLNAAAFERMTLENSLRKVFEHGGLLLHYQPRVDLNTGRIRGAEALLRWRHPELGLLLPAQFIALAEETGLIIPITEWVLGTACAQNKAWQEAGLTPIDVSVNISARLLQHEGLIESATKALKETGLEPRYLNLELTESTLMHNPDLATKLLTKLRAVGVLISVDHFGAGYSSLSYLRRLPVDAIKIDQPFVRDITTNPDDEAIVRAVLAMAHSLNLSVTAEGVETLEQLQLLHSLQCDEVQGYFVSRPVPADEFSQLLRDSGTSMANGIKPAA